MGSFSMLPPELLASASDITLPSLVDAQDRFAEEAKEIMPYSFDTCTFSKGYLRQSIWSCLECGQKGVCYGCSISCHAEHELVELWTKRSFQCDCPTEAMALPAGTSKRRCCLNPPETQPQPLNEKNCYSHNFAGKFCRCGRDYDPQSETEAMINCMACEDWFHESCLNLQPRRAPAEEPIDDDEDTSLIPSDSYDGLICAECAKHPFISERAGTPGWMIVVAGEKEGEWVVLGLAEVDKGSKRLADHEGEGDTKRQRGEGATVITVNAQTSTTSIISKHRCAGDVFLANGVRELLKSELDADVADSLPFPLVDEEIYEPPEDDDPPESLDQVTERAISSLPRVQAIEAWQGYQTMRDKLRVMLAAHVESGESVSREDIHSFFEGLRKE